MRLQTHWISERDGPRQASPPLTVVAPYSSPRLRNLAEHSVDRGLLTIRRRSTFLSGHEPPRRVIPQKVCNEAMRRFMKGDGDQYRNDPNRRQIDCIGCHRTISSRASTRFVQVGPRRWLGQRLQSVLPNPATGIGNAEFVSTRSHSTPPGKVHAPRMLPVSVSWSICQWHLLPRRMCLETLALSPPGPFAEPA